MNKAGIDLGTNTVRLLIVDEDNNDIVRQMKFVRLGENIDKTHKFKKEALKRTFKAINEYRYELKKYNVQTNNINFFSTSAARDAKNKDKLINGVEKILGVKPKIISGDLEAKLSFIGATSNIKTFGKTLVIDIGGGSTEFAFGKNNKLEKKKSLNIGSVRITEKFFSSIPPHRNEIKNATKFITNELKKVNTIINKAENIIGVAGTLTTITMYKNLQTKYDFNKTNGYYDRANKFVETTKKILSENITILKKYMPVSRADVIQGGALIFLEILKKVEKNKIIIISEKDILDSIVKY